jgi:hypothetical protein
VTPEYPAGIYCYFATVNSTWNSAYPYLVGPTYYGTKVAAKVTSITETVNTYTSAVGITKNQIPDVKATVFPNPTSDIIVVQIKDLVKENYTVTLYDITGKLIEQTILYQGSTIIYFDTKSLYAGEYFVTLTNNSGVKISKKIVITK